MSSKNFYYVAGVIKFDYKVAGYKDLIQIVQNRKENESFKQIIIRFVSETNL